MSRDDGLWIFLAATILRINGLLVDLALTKFHYPTITDFCRRNAWAGWIIIVIEVIGLIGLAIHFSPKEGGGR